MEINTGGIVAGAGTGASIGGTVGSVVPGIGTGIGAGIGAVIGSIAGFFGINTGGGSSTPGFDATVAKPNRGSGDTEYVSAVNREKDKSYGLAQEALKKVSPYDTQTISQINQKYNDYMSSWGDANNPNRNVARPDVFNNEMQSVIDKYVDPYATVASTNPTNSNANQFDIVFGADNSPGILNKNTGQIIPLSNTVDNSKILYTPASNDTTSQYVPYVIAGIGILALFLILRKKK
jgi:hypothetical protein